MYKKVSVTITTTLVIAAILTVSWSALQRSYAQSDFANTILKIHNDERAAVKVPDLTWSDSLAADAKKWAEHLASLPPKPSSSSGWNQCCGGAPDLVHGSTGENLWAGRRELLFDGRHGEELGLRKEQLPRCADLVTRISPQGCRWSVITHRWSGRIRGMLVARPP